MNRNIKICHTGYSNSKLYIKHIRYTSVRIKGKKKANKEVVTTLLKTKCTLPLEISTKLCTLASVLPQTAITSSVSTAYFAVSAPLVIRVLISSSWPYRAAICKGVFPFLSSQSITAPMIKDIVSDTRLYRDWSTL